MKKVMITGIGMLCASGNGKDAAWAAIRAGKNVGEIVPLWDADLARFKEARQNYLIYR